jgi:hypothetical protein
MGFHENLPELELLVAEPNEEKDWEHDISIDEALIVERFKHRPALNKHEESTKSDTSVVGVWEEWRLERKLIQEEALGDPCRSEAPVVTMIPVHEMKAATPAMLTMYPSATLEPEEYDKMERKLKRWQVWMATPWNTMLGGSCKKFWAVSGGSPCEEGS